MSFITRELSRMLGRPVALYYFNYGAGANSYYALTDAESAISAPGSLADETVSYTPAAISRERVTASGTLDKAQIAVTLPRDADLASLFVSYPPSQVVTVVIRAGHLGETSFPAIWSGRVVGMKFAGSSAIFQLEPIATSLRRNGLRRNYQYGCPHRLYGTQCNADKPAATSYVTVSSVSGSTLGLPASWYGAISLSKYLGGLVEWTTSEGNLEIRAILRTSGSQDLLLGGPIRNLSAGDTVAISLGCNHQQEDCLGLHVEADSSPPVPNIKNYGGQDWIPLKNPVHRNLSNGMGL